MDTWNKDAIVNSVGYVHGGSLSMHSFFAVHFALYVVE